MTEIHRYNAAGGVVIHNARMLLLDRPGRKEVRLPKGHMEAGETPEVTALREVAEESGYADLKIVTALDSQIVEFDHQGRHIIRTEYYFLMDLVSEQQVERGKHDAEQFQVRWTPLTQAVAQLTYSSEQSIARQAIQATGEHLTG